MDTVGYILQVFHPDVLGVILLGVVSGTIIGALPGLTATMGVALLIPMTFGMPAVTGLNMLIGIYVGAIYGGCISSILVKTPGTPASAATTLDGYPMAQKGLAANALGMATIASLIGGLFSSVVLACMAPMLAQVALKFGPAEYFSLSVFGLTIIATVSGDILKGLIVGTLGILLSTVGSDPMTGTLRFTFGSMGFAGGIAFMPALIGLFAISEVFVQLEHVFDDTVKQIKLAGHIPRPREVAACWKSLLRGSVIGTFVGIVPGTGSGVASWISYNEAKRSSKTPELYGTGLIDGIAATESANNAVCGGALVPLLALGIPGDAVTAVFVGGLMIQGLTPGPMLFQEHPDVIVGVFTGSFVANIFMGITGLLGIRLYSRVLNIPKKILILAICLFCFLGSYAMNGNPVDLFTMLIFGVVGYFFQKYNFSLAAMCIALILGPIAEANLRLAMLSSGGDPWVLITQPISGVFVLLSLLSLCYPIYRKLRLMRRGALPSDTPKMEV